MPHVGNKMEGEGPGGKISRRAEAAGSFVVDDKNSDTYRQKRDRNNLAVKKSREKMRQKCSETTQRMATLRAENEELQQKVNGLSTELSIMKELLLAHARGNRSSSSLTPTTTSSEPTIAQVSVTSPVATTTLWGKTSASAATTSVSRRVVNQPAAVIQIPTTVTSTPVSRVVSQPATVIQIPTSAILSPQKTLVDNKAAIFISPAVTAPTSTILVQAQHDHGYFVQPNKQILSVSMAGADTKSFVTGVSSANMLNVVPVLIQNQPQVYSLISSSGI